MILEPGVILNKRYTILEVIARGGMGAIYRADDGSLGVEVAVKENLITTEEFARQFHREATILAGMRHAHLPRVTDHFLLPDQGQYLVMDYIPGEDLRHRIARLGILSEAEALEIGLGICDAVSYLHHREPPILHRDIKPGNIKITPSGQAYLVDFGLAKIAQSGQQTTIGAQSLTPGFAPPEQYGSGTDQRSDLYALAATLYTMLCGKTPEDALSRAMGTSDLTPLTVQNPQISAETAAVIEHAIAIEPEKRYQTADEFSSALLGAAHRTLAAIPASTQPGNSPQPTADLASQTVARPSSAVPAPQTVMRPAAVQPAAAPRPKTAPWMAIGMFGLLLVGGLTGVGLIFLPRLANPAQPTATQAAVLAAAPSPVAVLQSAPTLSQAPTTSPVASATQAAALPATAAAPVASLTPPAPQGTPVGGGPGRIAFASTRSGSVQVWVMDLDGSHAQAITQMQDGACQPDWSPDGKRLAFVSPCKGKQDQYPGSSLFLINPDGSGVESLATTPGGDFDPAWSPDGTQIAFTSLRDGKPHIYLYTLAENKVARISPAPVYDRQPHWSPDGKSIVFTTTREGHNQIWTMSADGTKPQEFSKFDRGLASMPIWGPDGEIIYFCEGLDPPGLIAKRIDDAINEFPIAETVRPVLLPHFSPDGHWLMFEGASDGKPGLFRMTPNGTNLTRLTAGDTNDFQAVWQP
jgi:eukaryotic-like serine/threonine-protein kinase